jgi:lipopolysaccharide export system protein LptC
MNKNTLQMVQVNMAHKSHDELNTINDDKACATSDTETALVKTSQASISSDTRVQPQRSQTDEQAGKQASKYACMQAYGRDNRLHCR